jgi:hypothetical protein
MPNLLVVILDCAVGAEEARFCGVYYRALQPAIAILICLDHVEETLVIGCKIVKNEKKVNAPAADEKGE